MALDAADPLAGWRDEFVDPGMIYLDGNSLGMAPHATLRRVDEMLRTEWATDLIGSWEQWLDLPSRVGDRLAPIIGAEAGTVVVHDSTTINLYQAVHGALGLATQRRRGAVTTIAVDEADFPTDRYIVDGIAEAVGATVRRTTDDLDGVAVAVRSLVDYRTGRRLDLAGETERATAAGTVTVWDLSHAAGAVEIDVTAAGVELAVGCTYKYLNGGPGAPAFTYVRPDLQSAVRQPMWGWFAQRDQFEMADPFDPHPDPRRFLLGTPGIIGLAAAEVGIGMVADAGIAAVAAKGRALTEFALDIIDDLSLSTPTPRSSAERGAHVAVHVDADRLDDTHRDLTADGVIVDRRRPDLLRIGCSALTTRFTDVFDGLTAVARLVRP
ncbi:kynureninase [soil metagenome]